MSQVNQGGIVFPEFWKTIEKSFTLDPVGIKEIKEILTLLKYTTAESLTKFTKHDQIKLIELEFLSRKTEFETNHPHLNNFTFASGFYTNLASIAMKIKNKYVRDLEINSETILEKVLADGQKVCYILRIFYNICSAICKLMCYFTIVYSKIDLVRSNKRIYFIR